MRLALRLPLQRALDQWLFQLKSAEQGEVVLHQRRVFILPTKAGLAYVLMLLGLFIGSVNYGLNMGYALTFLVAGCALVGMVLTFRNLAYLRLTPGRCAPVFAGGQASYELRLANPGRLARYAIELAFLPDQRLEQDEQTPTLVDLAAFGESTVRLSTPAPRRGWQPAPRVRLQTRFPLGLLRAWSYWTPDMAVLVYPQPEEDGPPLPASIAVGAEGQGSMGQEDFAGVRPWQAGDAPSRLAWRQIARVDDGSLVSKVFEGGSSAELCIDESLAAELPLEERIARLTRWVLEAAQRGEHWRFCLGPDDLPAAGGTGHLEECLRLLALYQGGGR